MLADKVKQIIEERDSYKKNYQNLKDILMKHGINTESIQKTEDDLITMKNTRDVALKEIEERIKDLDTEKKKSQYLYLNNNHEIEKQINDNKLTKINQMPSHNMIPLNYVINLSGDKQYALFQKNKKSKPYFDGTTMDRNNANYCLGSKKIAVEIAVSNLTTFKRSWMSSNSCYRTKINSSIKEIDNNSQELEEDEIQRIALDISLARIQEMYEQMKYMYKHNEKLRLRVHTLEKIVYYSWKEYN